MSRELFEARISELNNAKKKNSVMITRQEYKEIFLSLKRMHRDQNYKPSKKEKNWISRYEIMSFELEGKKREYLVKPDPKKPEKKLRMVTVEGMYDAINKVHEATMHAGRRLTYPILRGQYANITEQHLQLFINCCQHCQTKNSGGVKKGIVVSKGFVFKSTKLLF